MIAKTTMSLSIQAVDAYFIEQYKPLLLKEGLCFCKKTKLFGCFIDNQFVGLTGILWYKTKVVFKNHFVFPENRKQGIFAFMLDYSIARVKETNVKIIEAHCLPASIPAYLNAGGKIIKTFKLCKKIHINL